MEKYVSTSRDKQDDYMNQVMDEMRKMVPTVYRDEDSEAVIGCNCMGDIRFCVTFSPAECADMDKHIKNGTLRNYIDRQSSRLKS